MSLEQCIHNLWTYVFPLELIESLLLTSLIESRDPDLFFPYFNRNSLVIFESTPRGVSTPSFESLLSQWTDDNHGDSPTMHEPRPSTISDFSLLLRNRLPTTTRLYNEEYPLERP